MILECLVASQDIQLCGVTLDPDLIFAKLPVPLLREHKGSPVGEVYHLALTSSGLVAICECSVSTADYSHVSPALRLMPADPKGGQARMKLLEVSLVRQPKSPHTLILARRAGDPVRAYARTLAERDDLIIRKFAVLQQIARSLQHANP